jgi:type I restriction enzyme R subunit
MAEAINSLPNGIKSNKSAVAETIANNVRSKIIKEHLNDPAFYDKMSTLLNEILADLRAKRIDYKEFLKRMAEVAKQVQGGKADDTPESLNTPGKRAIYNQLELEKESATEKTADEPPAAYMGVLPGSALDLALQIDKAVKNKRPDGWRGVLAKERIVKGIIHDVVLDAEKVERLYLIIFAQREY